MKKRVQFRGNNFDEVVNFCTNHKVKNLIGFEFKKDKNCMCIKTTTNEYIINVADFIFIKYNKLSYYKTALSFKEMNEQNSNTQKMIPIE